MKKLLVELLMGLLSITRYKRLLNGTSSPAQVIWGMMPTDNIMVYGKGEVVPDGCIKKAPRPEHWGNEYNFLGRCNKGC